MTPRMTLNMLASVFLGLGAWARFLPEMVERLVFVPAHRMDTPASHLLIACFGAHAVLAGIVIAISQFQAHTFFVFGLVGSAPFFVFNYCFVFVVEMFTAWMLLDFIGNLGTLTLCLLGYRGLTARGATGV